MTGGLPGGWSNYIHCPPGPSYLRAAQRVCAGFQISDADNHQSVILGRVDEMESR